VPAPVHPIREGWHEDSSGVKEAFLLSYKQIYGNVFMKHYTAVVERDPDTGLYVGYVPGFPGAHSQSETLDELNRNLQEVIAMLLEDGEPKMEAEFVGIQTVQLG
jgi:predicted RNase H-like HicB family nuclease